MKSKASVQLQQRNYVQERPFLSSVEPIPFDRNYKADLSPQASLVDDTQKIVTWRVRIVSILRVICGCICLYDIWSKWQAGLDRNYLATLTQAVHSQIPIATIWFNGWLHIAQINPQGLALIMGLLEVCVGLCLISGILTRLVCGIGVALTLAGGIGGGLLSTASKPVTFDIGILIIFLLAFIGLLLMQNPNPSKTMGQS